MADDLVPQRVVNTENPLVTALVARIRGIADGNGVRGSDVSPTDVEVIDRKVGVRMDVGLGWRWTSTPFKGSFDPGNGSIRVADAATAHREMKRKSDTAYLSKTESEALLADLKGAPLARLATTEAGDRRVLSKFHCHEVCDNCAGRGRTPCSCDNGKLPCTRHHPYTQNITCWRCNGQQGYTAWNGNTSYFKRCEVCNGAGTMRCPDCDVFGKVLCNSCSGSGSFACNPCGSTGNITQSFCSFLTIKPTSSWLFGDAPDGFKETISRSISTASMAETHATSWTLSEAASWEGGARIGIQCVVQHTKLTFNLPRKLTFEAAGKQNVLREMPPFLQDLLISDIAIAQGKEDPEGTIAGAKSSRVGTMVLESISSGKSLDAATISQRFGGAITPDSVTEWADGIEHAYHKSAESAVGRVWMWMGPLAVLGSAVAAYFGVQDTVLDALLGPMPLYQSEENLNAWMPHLPFALAPVGIAWFGARLYGIRAASVAIGHQASKGPRQTWRPALWGALACAMYATVVSYGMPTPAPVPPPSNTVQRVIPAAPTAPAAPAASAAPTVPEVTGVAPRATRPALVYRPPAEGELRGTPAVFRLQHQLRALGFRSAPPDGVVSPQYRQSVEQMLAAGAPERRPEVQRILDNRGGFTGVAEAALADRIRLEFPADASAAAGAGNMVRGRLTADDLNRLNDAAVRAANAVGPTGSVNAIGTPATWRSADNQRGGSVTSLTNPSIRRPCSKFNLEFEIDGAVQDLRDVYLCFSGMRWTGRAP